MLRKLINLNISLSLRCDNLLFRRFTIDGNGAFNHIVPGIVGTGIAVADVGGGRTPFFSVPEVLRRGLRVTGVDIDAQELGAAPPGAYAKLVTSALEDCSGPAEHDLVIAQSVLEHVRNGRDAMRGIASLLKTGGKVITFCPNRRAWFARLNLILPERMKRAILFFIFPRKRERQGFPANYDGCTPGEMEDNMRLAGICPVQIQYFFVSSYFMFFFPLYFFWRIFTYPLMRFWPHRYCETFIVIGIREPNQKAAALDDA